MKLSEYIEKSWTYINSPAKWIKGTEHSDDGSAHCSVGALYACGADLVKTGVISEPEATTLYSQAQKHLDKEASRVDPEACDIVDFNDSIDTTHRKLRKVWKAVIKNLQKTDH